MKNFEFQVEIKAPASVVWKVLTDQDSFRTWSKSFDPNSHFEGTWEKDSVMKFLGNSEAGAVAGVAAKVVDCVPNKRLELAHFAEIIDGKEVQGRMGFDENQPMYESYELAEAGGVTTLSIRCKMPNEFAEMLMPAWPLAIDKMKEISEAGVGGKCTISALVGAPIDTVWTAWTSPKHITQWSFASDDWESPEAENDLAVGGKFRILMAARDGSAQFDFEGTYTTVRPNELIEYEIPDGRKVSTRFTSVEGGVKVTGTFDIEEENPAEMQRAGWQGILDNFKAHAESLS